MAGAGVAVYRRSSVLRMPGGDMKAQAMMVDGLKLARRLSAQ
jgi:hypothetical protein